MCKILKEWAPSEAAVNLIKLNGIDEDQIAKTLDYLKNESELNDIKDVRGYDNWNSFFIIFCIKANKQANE